MTAGLLRIASWTNGIKAAVSVGLLAATMSGTAARASGPDESILDATALIQLEQRADRADQREQCYLYTQLLHALTELAGRQVTDGQEADAGQTVRKIDTISAKIQSATARNAKKLREAEELMNHTQRRLQDMSRVVSADERQAMQATVQKLNQVHSQVLNMVFLQ